MLKTLVIPERARNIVIAVAVAAFAAMLTAFYVSNYKRHVQQDQKNVPVLVAAKTIEAGTPGDEVLSKNLAVVRELPRRSVVEGSFADPTQIEKLVSTQDVYAGEQITARRFAPLQERGVRSKLEGNLRAIEVTGTRDQLLAGTLKEGDRVDVVANFDFRRGGSEFVFTRVVLRDILVLRGAKGADGSAVSDSDEVTAQLAVTDAQSQKLFFATKNGEWTLDIRAVNDATDSPESVETYPTILTDGLRPAQRRKLFFGR
jgi:Flp pilus assembly protein CpaB